MKIIISYYNSRPFLNLLSLYSSLDTFRDDIIIVENFDHQPFLQVVLPTATVIPNQNKGMNIGAWTRGFLEAPNEDFYVFLQDECFLKRKIAIAEITMRFDNNPGLGLLGETLNYRWNQGWDDLAKGPLNRIEDGHYIENIPAPRVDTYLDCMRRWGINPGDTGLHLRSLMWATSGPVMHRLGGFPVGRNKGECIAAEIGVSCAVRAVGLLVEQLNPQPFWGFGHREWRPDGTGKL